MEHLFISPYRLFSCNLLFYIRYDSFDCPLQQGDIQPVMDFHPPSRCSLVFSFQRVCEVLHLGFDELLPVIDVDGFKGCIGFFFGKGVNVNEKVGQSLIIKNRSFLLLAQYSPILFFCQPHCSLPTEAA